MKLRFYSLPAAIVLSLLPINHGIAQTANLPDCASPDSDPDGDGFGWEDNQSCRVISGQLPQVQTGQCIDTDGDGFGWNGIETCDPSMNTAVVTQPQALQCVDSDGDGFGWNGVETCDPSSTVIDEQPQLSACVDSDGDGWGWDGQQSCRVTTSFQALNTDPTWTFCDTNGLWSLPVGEVFGTPVGTPRPQTLGSSLCVRQCSSTASELTDIPGWGYDSEAAAECVFDNRNSDDNIPNVAVPIYDPALSNTRLEFVDQFGGHLYGAWQCSFETRSSNREPFISDGRMQTFEFNSAGEKWRFATAYERRILQIRESADQSSGRYDYFGYTQLEHNSLVIYSNSLERLTCSAQNPTPDYPIPANVDVFEQLPDAPFDELLGRTMQCQVTESMERSQNTGWESGYVSTIPTFSGRESSRGRITGAVYEIEPRFELFDENQNSRYRISTDTEDSLYSTRHYRYENDVFTDFFGGTSSAIWQIRFKNMGNYFVKEDFSAYFASGGGGDSISYSVCY